MSNTDSRPPTPNPPPSAQDTSLQTYNILANKVGGVPNLRKKDNLYQGIAIAVTSVVGVIIGFAMGRSLMGALVGLLGGLIAGTLLSGFVLMVIGLTRKP